MTTAQRLIIGISGASGVIYGIRLLELLRPTAIETHLVMTTAAEMTLACETDIKPDQVRALADVNYGIAEVGAGPASGSFRSMGMVVAPCSIRSMSEIACGVTSNLLTRAADVMLKERRRLVLMVRETPLHAGHLRSLTGLAELGAIIAPPAPAFYPRPQSIDELVTHGVGRVLDLFDIDVGAVTRWREDRRGRAAIKPVTPITAVADTKRS